jgi:hypothetical protein
VPIVPEKREELEQRHRVNERAANRQREREKVRRREQEGQAKEREGDERREKLERMAKKRLQLEERTEEQAKALRTTLEELLALDWAHKRTLGPFSIRAGEPPPPDLARELSAWFRSLFGGIVSGLGSDVLAPSYGKAGPSLSERDPLSPTHKAAEG